MLSSFLVLVSHTNIKMKHFFPSHLTRKNVSQLSETVYCAEILIFSLLFTASLFQCLLHSDLSVSDTKYYLVITRLKVFKSFICHITYWCTWIIVWFCCLFNLYLSAFLSTNHVSSVQVFQTLKETTQQQECSLQHKTWLAKTSASMHISTSTSYSTSALLLRHALISLLYI